LEDIKAYIESGILELYVLGDVTPEEKRQVEEIAAKHPAIKAELGEIERSMELYAEANAVEPAADLRERILNSIVTNYADDSTHYSCRCLYFLQIRVCCLPCFAAGEHCRAGIYV